MEYRRKKRVLASYRKMNKRKLWLASGMTMMAISTGMYATQNVKADQVSVEAQNTQQVATDKDNSNVSNEQNDQTTVQLDQNISEREAVQNENFNTNDQAKVELNATAQEDNSNTTEQVQTKDTSLVDDAIEDANATQELQLTTDEKKVNENAGEKVQAQQLQVNKVATKTQTPDAIYIGDSQYTHGDAIDVASYQSWLNQDDFNKLKQLGIKAVVVKLTEGQSYVNPAATKQINYAKNAGLTVSVYHYARFNNATTGYAEGQHIANTMENLGLGQDTLIFADMEDHSTYSNDVRGNLNSFWNALTAAGFNNHGVYTGGGYPYHEAASETVGKAKTWWSQYPFVPTNNGYYEKEWKNLGYGAWQFSSTAYIPGRENMGALDLSIDFNGLFSKSDTTEKTVTQQVFKDGHWYLIDQKTGQYLTGIQPITDQNKVVYYNDAGQMQYGQQNITGHWYLFDNNGAMQRGFQNLKDYGDNKTVYYNQDGWMQYGWQWLDNATRYFDTYDGAMAIGQKKINDHWYLFDKNGAMQRGFQYLPEDKKVAYYNQDGWMLYGKQDISGKTYSFNTYNGALENMDGQQKLGDHWYLFNKGEVLTGFQEIKDQNKTVYYDPSTARMQYGWQTIANNKYYFDTYDGAMYTGSHLIDGVDYSFDDDGTLLPLTIQAYREMVAKEVADDIKKNYAQSIDYDWNNQNDNYLAFTLHDTAQLVARNNLAATSEAVQKNLVNNSLFTGTANIVWTKSYKDMHQAITQAANDFMTTFVPTIDLSKSAIGVGAKEMDDSINVAIIIFTPGKDDKPKEELADSALTANVSEVYTAPGVNTQAHDGLRSGDTISASELGNTFKVSPSLLNGVKGQKIGEQNLKLIFSSLPGNETGLEGQKLYKGIDGNDYHYVFWLNDTFAGQKVGKQEAFLAANKDAVYGDPLKVSYSATLTWGAPVEVSIGVTGVPTSQMTDEQIDLAYKTGTNTGLRYDAVTVKPIEGMTEDMIRGVDIGSYQSLINAGVKFYDFDGNEAPIYKVLKDAGVNWIRLRVWNDPYDVNNNTYAGGDCSEANVVQMAKDASKYGLKVLLDFHYSDFWADPAKQPLPKAWEDQTGDSLAKSVYNYTSKVLTDLKNAGVDVGMVQVGNEITNGVFGIYSNRDRGESYLNIWGNKEKAAQISRYLNAGSKAVRDVLPDAKVAIQLETPNVPKYTNIMNALRDNNVDYDILGTSYYPFWSTHDGNGWYDDVDMGWGANTPKSLEGIEKLAKQEYGKQVVVLETGWINNVRDSDGTGNSIGPDSEIQAYSHDPQGQVDAMADMYKALVAQGGLGGFWWEPAWIPVKVGWENWQFNKDASDKYGTGWASQYAVGYAPDSVMYYNGQPTWGGSTWDNVALFDDLGHPLQSLKMYNGFLHGYESPKAPEKATSTLNFKVNKVWNSNNVALKDGIVEGSTLTASDMLEPLSAAANELLSGTGAFTQENLEKIASGLGGMTTALEGSKTYYADNGDAYHYVFWFTEGKTAEQKAWNFYNDNMNAKYGEPLVVNVEATVTWGAAKA